MCMGFNPMQVQSYQIKFNYFYITTAVSHHFSDANYELSEVQQEVTLQLVSPIVAEVQYSRTVQLKNGSAACKLGIVL